MEKGGNIAPEEQFFRLSTIFCYLVLDFYVKIRIRFSLRDKRLFEIIKIEITKVDCILKYFMQIFCIRHKHAYHKFKQYGKTT